MEQTGDCTPILPLVHHNHLDILSLLPLVGELARRARALSAPTAPGPAPSRSARTNAEAAKPRVAQPGAARSDAPRAGAVSEIVVERDEEPVRRPRKTPRAPAPAPKLSAEDAVPMDAAPRALRDRARALQATGEWQAAIRVWTQCADALPTDADPHLELSKLHEVALGDLEQALFHAQRALTLAPWSAPVLRRVDALRGKLERG
jgi:tetratricopeptide (TPR) repeat protein